MTPESQKLNRASGPAVGFTIVSLIFGALVIVVKLTSTEPAIDADRNDTIGKSLSDIRKTESDQLATAGWIDQSRGVVRLPIETAMQIAAGKTTETLRAELKDRVEKASAPAPKAPEKPSAFE